MAISRKSSAGKKSKAAKSAGSKKASPARKAGRAKAAGGAKGAKARPSKASKASRPSKPAKPAPHAVVKARPAARPSQAPAAKPSKAPLAVSGKAVPVKGKATVKVVGKPAVKAKPKPAEVHPIGMLPAVLIARSNAKSAPAAPRAVVRKAPAAPSTHQGVQTVTDEDIKEFETRLLEERQRMLKEMGHLESTVFKVNQRDSSGDLSGYAFHMADAGTDAMEREKAFLFASAEGRVLMEIDQALRRLYQGDYGKCESCGQPIGRARLQAIPQARLCVSCKEKEERASRGAS